MWENCAALYIINMNSVFKRRDRRRNCRSDRRADRLLDTTVAATGCADDRLVWALCNN